MDIDNLIIKLQEALDNSKEMLEQQIENITNPEIIFHDKNIGDDTANIRNVNNDNNNNNNDHNNNNNNNDFNTNNNNNNNNNNKKNKNNNNKEKQNINNNTENQNIYIHKTLYITQVSINETCTEDFTKSLFYNIRKKINIKLKTNKQNNTENNIKENNNNTIFELKTNK